MSSFYDPRISITDRTFQLTEEESKHICRVLRMKENEHITLLDGKGRSFSCSIKIADAKKCVLNVLGFTEDDKPEYNLHIAVALTKNMERIEWFVEKSTEIGITELSFIHSQNSERTKFNEDRIQRILVAAMKQSNRTFLPIFNGLISFSNFVKSYKSGCIAYCGEEAKTSLKDSFKAHNCPVLIGPEGDFHPNEISLAKDSGYRIVTLGDNRLRTETAALVACVQSSMLLMNV